MNAKELIEAAEEVLSSHDPACSHIWNAHRSCQWCHRDRRDVYVDDIARHILATVHPDDDEPVTLERLEADGWFRRSIRYRHWESQISVIEQHPEFLAEFETGQQICRLNNMGHLRRLVAALGE